MLKNILSALIITGLAFAQTNFEKRADELVSQMTLEEKIGEMVHQAHGIPRLGIDPYNWWNECLHGVARNGIATVFPQAIGIAATWNPNLVLEMADIISTEGRAKHHEALRTTGNIQYSGLTFWSPNINIFRDPRWGRGQETYGEDPYLTAQIGTAFVKGIQGENPLYYKAIATAKHFAVHSGPEPERHHFDAKVSSKDLFDTYLPAFEALVLEARVYSVMGAYNRLNGEACCASKYLLEDILRKKWGFKGYVVSDCGAIWDIWRFHKIVPTSEEAAAMSVKSGCDLNCGGEYHHLMNAVKIDLVSEKVIDKTVRRLMLARLKLGMFDNSASVPYTQIPYAINDCAEHNTAALKVARESIVLLKNDGILPLNPHQIKQIAVVGPYINDIEMQYGNYNGTASNPVSYLEGLKKYENENLKIVSAIGVTEPEGLPQYEPLTTENLFYEKNEKARGLKAEYFNRPDLSGKPYADQIETDFSPYYDVNAPLEGMAKDFFSVRWTGYIKVTETGTYEIGIETDDKGRLEINGNPIADNWQDFKINTFISSKIHLEADRYYAFKMEFGEEEGYAGLRLKWRRLKNQDPRESERNLTAALNLAEKSDVIVACCGISPRLEGEEIRGLNIEGFNGGDRTHLKLPENQRNFLKKLHALGKPVVLVLSGGCALAVNWSNENLNAILHAWYPGQRGGDALADVIFGQYNPAGRLPVTFYKSVTDLPPFEDYAMKNRTYRYFDGDVLYPFGHGLSYTTFDYENLGLSTENLSAGEEFEITFNLKNSGFVDGDEVVQVYVTKDQSELWRENLRLVGFCRTHLKKGENKTLSLCIHTKNFRTFDESLDDYTVEKGLYRILVGQSSKEIRLSTEIHVR
ncbi:MAG: glycoside hydrolase family 3 C-terminal domain-containing protein [Candidatus Marinimicrobia bacterium]|nr:glycoside hydrolase family 3 C-terminal domain-containing protein [Candidatus Neomarinimicrobiota bacterium]